MHFLKASYHKTKAHHKNFALLVLTALLTPLLIFGIYSIFPAKVKAVKQSFTKLDQKIEIEIWGLLNKDKIELKSNYDTPLKATLRSESLNLKNTLTIIPKDLLYPETEYKFDVIVRNWLGIKSKKSIIITTSSIPKVTLVNKIPDGSKVSANTTLIFDIDQEIDSKYYSFSSNPIYEYNQLSKNNQLQIKPKNSLNQGEDYSFTLRLKSQTLNYTNLITGNFSVIDPLLITESNPQNHQEMVLKNTSPKISFSKDINKETFLEAVSTEPLLEFNPNWLDSKTVELSLSKPMQTSTKYSLTISDKLKAQDGAVLTHPQIISFQTAGKIKVLNITPVGSLVPTNKLITVKFNQPVEHSSAESKFKISPKINGSFSWSNNSMFFKPSSLGLLINYSIKIEKGVKSIGGEDSLEVFSGNFTTTSERTRIIGYSVKKRPISATYFGIGAKKIVLVGTIHGSESNTGNMLTQWVSYLRTHQQLISKDRTFVIVAYANPDGKFLNQRFNANNVDLNRNWGTFDWQALTYWQSRSYPKGGGKVPFSEPETKALKSLINLEKPTHLITYHSAANMVIGDGIATTFGNWYAKKTGYKRVYGDNENDSDMSALGYIITGALEEWVSTKGVITLVVEFISSYQSEYQRNLTALKGLLTYPI